MRYNEPMQYADVALNVKTKTRQESFTYAIPPALLLSMRPGQRVEVPFHGRILIGTILKLRPLPPKIRGIIKQIKALVEPFPFFDASLLELCYKVSRYYAATVGEVLATAAPRVAKRVAKKTADDTRPPVNKIIQSQTLILYRPYIKRINNYRQVIKKTLANNGRVLILFPDHPRAANFSESLTNWGINHILMAKSEEKTATYEAYVRSIFGESPVVVGTRKTIFCPVQNLRLIIIDSPSEFGYKEEQFPYYHAVTVGKLRAQTAGCHLLLADCAPRLIEWQEIKKNKVKFLTASNERRTAVTILDTASNRGLLSDALLQRLRHALEKKQQCCLFFNRKGEGRYYRCLDCEVAIYCPRCDTLLTVSQVNEKTALICPHCEYKTAPPLRCLNCQSYRMASAGVGVNLIIKKLAKEFPHATLVALTADTDTVATALSADIVVATSFLFSQPPSFYFDLLAVFHVDQLLHGHKWDMNEEAFLQLKRLAQRTDHLLINSSLPDHPVIIASVQNNIDFFYQKELNDRQKYAFPPVSPMLKLSISGKNKDPLHQAANELYAKLAKLLVNAESILLPPSPVGSGKRRDKFRYQIVIKSALTPSILQNVPDDWQIDTEPISF